MKLNVSDRGFCDGWEQGDNDSQADILSDITYLPPQQPSLLDSVEQCQAEEEEDDECVEESHTRVKGRKVYPRPPSRRQRETLSF